MNRTLILSISWTNLFGSRSFSLAVQTETTAINAPRAITLMTINKRGLKELISHFGSSM